LSLLVYSTADSCLACFWSFPSPVFLEDLV